jgi:hypothetical protein
MTTCLKLFLVYSIFRLIFSVKKLCIRQKIPLLSNQIKMKISLGTQKQI